jgi:hypothetical protein
VSSVTEVASGAMLVIDPANPAAFLAARRSRTGLIQGSLLRPRRGHLPGVRLFPMAQSANKTRLFHEEHRLVDPSGFCSDPVESTRTGIESG